MPTVSSDTATCLVLAGPAPAPDSPVQQVLESVPYDICRVDSAVEALAVIEKRHAVFLIIDTDLADLDSAKLLDDARARFPAVGVLVLTSDVSVEAAVCYLKRGAVDYIGKPVDSERLRRVIQATTDEQTEVAIPCGTDTAKAGVPGYRLDKLLVKTANTRVFRAWRGDGEDAPKCAVKILSIFERGRRRRQAHARFMREIELLSSFRHPNIIRILDTGSTAEGLPFVAMELLHGRTLRQLLDDGESLTRHQQAALMRQAAGAIQCVHGRGIIHRDIKPDNFTVDDNLWLRLTEFGVARTPESGLTKECSLLGTPAYFAPEVLSAVTADPRADLFSLGVMTYELACGRRPFVADTLRELATTITEARPRRPTTIDPTFPPAFEKIIGTMLRKRPADRYSDAGSIVKDLTAFVEDRPLSAVAAGLDPDAVWA